MHVHIHIVHLRLRFRIPLYFGSDGSRLMLEGAQGIIDFEQRWLPQSTHVFELAVVEGAIWLIQRYFCQWLHLFILFHLLAESWLHRKRLEFCHFIRYQIFLHRVQLILNVDYFVRLKILKILFLTIAVVSDAFASNTNLILKFQVI